MTYYIVILTNDEIQKLKTLIQKELLFKASTNPDFVSKDRKDCLCY